MAQFDASSLTLGEIAKVEDISGQSIGSISDDSAPKGHALSALVYVLKRREDPAFTLASAERFTLEEATELLSPSEPADGEDPDAEKKDASIGLES